MDEEKLKLKASAWVSDMYSKEICDVLDSQMIHSDPDTFRRVREARELTKAMLSRAFMAGAQWGATEITKRTYEPEPPDAA